MAASDDDEEAAGSDPLPAESWCLYAPSSDEAEAELASLLSQHAALTRHQRPSASRYDSLLFERCPAALSDNVLSTTCMGV